MSNSTASIYDLIADNQTAIVNIGTSEYPTAALTLTRSATLPITTAGTLITWQTENRNFGFTWTGTTITIPTSGYYNLTMFYSATLAHAITGRLYIGGVNVDFFTTSSITSTRQALTLTRYFTTGDSVEINLLPNVNTTINVVAENSASESPLLHVVQLTGAYD